MKRCYLVVGPESSGTRMLARALVLVGVVERQDIWDFGNEPDLSQIADIPDIVIHRSIPHGQFWPDLRKLTETINATGRRLHALMMTRDINATVKSQIKRGFFDTEKDAHRIIHMARQAIMANVPYPTPISYEAFCDNPGFRKWLFTEHLGLPESPIDIWPANGQYYD